MAIVRDIAAPQGAGVGVTDGELGGACVEMQFGVDAISPKAS